MAAYFAKMWGGRVAAAPRVGEEKETARCLHAHVFMCSVPVPVPLLCPLSSLYCPLSRGMESGGLGRVGYRALCAAVFLFVLFSSPSFVQLLLCICSAWSFFILNPGPRGST